MNPSEESILPKGRGRGPWKHGHDHKELRRPRTDVKIGSASHNSNSQTDPGAGGDVKKTTSTLSVNAKEFYPKGYQPVSVENSYNSQYSEPAPEGGDSTSYDATCLPYQNNSVQIAINHLLEIMHHITLNPGRFDDLISPLVDTFKIWMGNESIISAIINELVEQSITEPNFRYNGARLCSFLNNEFPFNDIFSFRRSLLKRCQDEHRTMRINIYSNPARLRGYVLFMAELFMQLEVTKGCGKRITVLGSALLEAINILLTEPSSENIKCVCQVLKLTGHPLDDEDTINMGQVIHTLSMLYNNPMIESSVRNLISSVIELRQRGWGEASSFMSNATTTQQYNSCSQDEPVFYGPDGQIMTAEESQFLQESVDRITDTDDYDEFGEDGAAWVPDDEMDEEIQAAFEQFLKMGKNQSKDKTVPENKCSD